MRMFKRNSVIEKYSKLYEVISSLNSTNEKGIIVRNYEQKNLKMAVMKKGYNNIKVGDGYFEAGNLAVYISKKNGVLEQGDTFIYEDKKYMVEDTYISDEMADFTAYKAKVMP